MTPMTPTNDASLTLELCPSSSYDHNMWRSAAWSLACLTQWSPIGWCTSSMAWLPLLPLLLRQTIHTDSNGFKLVFALFLASIPFRPASCLEPFALSEHHAGSCLAIMQRTCFSLCNCCILCQTNSTPTIHFWNRLSLFSELWGLKSLEGEKGFRSGWNAWFQSVVLSGRSVMHRILFVLFLGLSWLCWLCWLRSALNAATQTAGAGAFGSCPWKARLSAGDWTEKYWKQTRSPACNISRGWTHWL